MSPVFAADDAEKSGTSAHQDAPGPLVSPFPDIGDDTDPFMLKARNEKGKKAKKGGRNDFPDLDNRDASASFGLEEESAVLDAALEKQRGMTDGMHATRLLTD